jgi:predicted XRE-type DNA-binding protein
MRRDRQIEQDLKQQLAQTLCTIISGCDQCNAAGLLGVDQAFVSRLRRGQLGDISVSRLIRLVAHQGYDVELTLRAFKRFVRGRTPTVTVVRYDLYGGVASPDS